MTKPVRILYVHNSADLYGASRSLLRLAPRIRQRGYDPLVMLPELGPLKEQMEALDLSPIVEEKLPVIDRGTFKSVARLTRFLINFPSAVKRLSHLIRSQGIRIVHTNTGVIPAPALAARRAGVPHVWHVRDSFQEFRSLWSVYRRYITGLSARVVCVSNPVAAQFAGAVNVRVIHNGIPLEEVLAEGDIESLRRAFREKYRLEDAPVVGCVGRIKYVRKGQEVLVQAAALLKKRGVRAKFLIVGQAAPGNEEHRTKLEQLVQDLGLRQDVLMTGELADPKPAYTAMDIYVLPSAQPEPFGGVVLEAMAMKRPVVATAIGGSLDQVIDGQTGFLIPPGAPSALAEKLEVLLKDEEMRKRMGEAGRARLEKCFSADQMVDQIEALYREVLSMPS